MLIDILRMPPIRGIPVDRRLTVVTNQNIPTSTREPIVYWPSIPFYQSQVTMGSVVDFSPSNLYKAVHVSHMDHYKPFGSGAFHPHSLPLMKDRWVFETVFAMEGSTCVCLYTKLISDHDVRVAISLPSLRHYQSVSRELISISQLPIGDNGHSDRTQDYFPLTPPNSINNLVPPIFDERTLFRHVHRLLDIHSGAFGQSRVGWVYKPIYDYEPSVMDALIHGEFRRSPFHEIGGSHPSIQVDHDKWFRHEEIDFMVAARGFKSYINHQHFDGVALSLVEINTTKLTITCLFQHALDGVKDLWLTKDCHDPYRGFLSGTMYDFGIYREKISEIFYRCAKIYCKLFFISAESFLDNTNDHSSITISKNIYDEITIVFHDMINDQYICFYTSFPALALTTLAVSEVC